MGGIGGGGLLFYTYTGAIGSETYSERMRLDSSGNLGLGVTPSGWTSVFKAAQVKQGSISTDSSNNTTFANNCYFDGSNWKYINTAASQQYLQYAGQHIWNTAPSGTGGATPDTVSFTQAMTLDASGKLLLGNTDSTSAKLNVTVDGVVITGNTTGVAMGANAIVQLNNSNTVTDSTVMLLGGTTGGSPGQISSGFGFTRENSAANWGTQIRFYTHPPDVVALTTLNEAMRIDSSGNLLVGTTALNSTWTTSLTISRNSGTTKWAVGPWSGGENSFIISTSGTGGVYLNGTSATSWSANSDERLKENLVPIENAVLKVCSLRTVIGNYIADEEKTSHAFLIAQDVQAVLPQAVGPTTLPDGTEVLGLAYTETIPLLVAAIKEQQALITQLTARITALESA
jgi:hypothetical protein